MKEAAAEVKSSISKMRELQIFGIEGNQTYGLGEPPFWVPRGQEWVWVRVRHWPRMLRKQRERRRRVCNAWQKMKQEGGMRKKKKQETRTFKYQREPVRSWRCEGNA